MRLYVSPLRFALNAVLPILLGGNAGAATFDDGPFHVIDAGNSFLFEGITVQDGPGGTTTTVVVVTQRPTHRQSAVRSQRRWRDE